MSARARASRAPSSATTSAAARRRTAPTRTAQPGSIGGGTTPGKVFKGTGMAGHMGNDRATVKKATVVRADAERNLLLVKGPVPGARNALVIVRKAKPMPTTTLYTKTGAESRHGRAAGDAVRGAGQRGRHAPGRGRAAGRAAAIGTARHQDARRGPRRWRQAVSPEGHRPRPPGLASRAALRRRRRRLRAAPALATSSACPSA